MRAFARLFSRDRDLQRRSDVLVGSVPASLPLCGQIATALAVDLPLATIRHAAGDEPLTPQRTFGLLARFGSPPRVVWGEAFAQFYPVHVARHGGTAFRAVAFDIKPDADTKLGHAVYLHGEQLYDPATGGWRRTSPDDLQQFDFVAILPERARAS